MPRCFNVSYLSTFFIPPCTICIRKSSFIKKLLVRRLFKTSYIVKVIASTTILKVTETYSWFYPVDYDEASHPSALIGGEIAFIPGVLNSIVIFVKLTGYTDYMFTNYEQNNRHRQFQYGYDRESAPHSGSR